MKSCAPDRRQAMKMRLLSASGLTMRSVSMMGPLNQYDCWGRQPTQRPRSPRENCAMSYSSMNRLPCVGWYRPASSLASVDLPAPLRPRMAWMPPGPICSETWSSATWPDG
ncbi:hypothetical protein D3C86_1591650 [compost metagenome]